jgi:DNA-directed RNA polymerase specialized sigma24 family protein
MMKFVSSSEHKSTNALKVELAQKIHEDDSIYSKVEDIIKRQENLIGFLYQIIINLLQNRCRKCRQHIDVMDKSVSIEECPEYTLALSPSNEQQYLLAEMYAKVKYVFSDNEIDFMEGRASVRELADEEGVAKSTWFSRLENKKKLFQKKFPEYEDFFGQRQTYSK